MARTNRGYKIRAMVCDWALDIPMGDTTFVLYFSSRNNAELVKEVLEWEDAHPNEATPYQPTLTPQNEWVSVENAVPDPGERVLATDGTFVGEAYRTSANTWYRHTGFPWRDCLQSIVTLWMPLPTADKDNHVPAKAPNEPLTCKGDENGEQ